MIGLAGNYMYMYSKWLFVSCQWELETEEGLTNGRGNVSG
jgi:hypothetical protein